MQTILGFVKKNTVLCIALLAALVTSFIVPPDSAYLGYFDFKTLTCLFCVLAVVCALKNVNFFYTLAEKIVALTGNIRVCVLTLVAITFIGSMLIANDKEPTALYLQITSRPLPNTFAGRTSIVVFFRSALT